MIEYHIMNQENISDAATCIAESFANDEPLTRSLNIDEQDFLPFALDLCNSVHKERLSWVALDPSNSKLIGVRLASNSRDQSPAPSKIPPNLAKILSFIGTTKKNALKSLPVEMLQNDSIYTLMMAVNRDYRGQGIGRQLLINSCKNAGELGYRYSFGEVTNPASKAVVKHFNPVVLTSTPCYSAEVEGVPVFNNLAPSITTSIYYLDLQNQEW